METRLIEISLETAKRWYAQGGEQKDMALGAFTLEELGEKLPSTFVEYLGRCMKWGIKVEEDEYIDINPQIEAVKKLMLLRDFYNNNWKPDWTSYSDSKFGITKVYKSGDVNCEYSVEEKYNPVYTSWLVFNDKKHAEAFLNNFRELIEAAGDLI